MTDAKKTNTEGAPGSPQTAGTKDNNLGEGGKKATEGNKSPATVGGQTTDNSPATPPGDHANVAGATQDPKNPAVVGKEDVADRKGDPASKTPTGDYIGTDPVPGDGKAQTAEGDPKPIAEATRTIPEDEFEKARNEPESPMPSDDDLDEADGLVSVGRIAERGTIDATQQAVVKGVLEKLANLSLDVIQSTSPDSYNLFGYGGVNVSLGDIRALSRAYRSSL